jgi:dihydroorotase
MPYMRNDSVAIINANIVNEGLIFQGDLLIKAGRIIKIGPSIHTQVGTKVIDAKGKYLFPGLIDDQVHFRGHAQHHQGQWR